MNIFCSDPSPRQSALYLDDRRANQMVRESGQLLSTAIREKTVEPPEGLYESFNPGHPCAVWCRSSPARFHWLMQHMHSLLQRSKPDTHVRAREVLQAANSWFRVNSHRFPKDGLLPFNNSAANKEFKVDFTSVQNPVMAYRTYLNFRWARDARPPTWKTGQQPDWFRNLRG